MKTHSGEIASNMTLDKRVFCWKGSSAANTHVTNVTLSNVEMVVPPRQLRQWRLLLSCLVLSTADPVATFLSMKVRKVREQPLSR